MGKGSSKKTTPSYNPYGGTQAMYGSRMKNSGTKGGTASKPKPAKPKVDYQKKYRSAQQANTANMRKYYDVSRKYNQRMTQDKADPNRNLQASIVRGNESNTRSITSFNSMADNLTNQLNSRTSALTGRTQGELDTAYNKYNSDMQGWSDNMGKADQDIHTRNRGQAYAGLDSGFGEASDELQASLARRGLSNAGIGAKSMGDLAQDRMRAGSQAGVNAYTSAIDMSDSRRQQRMNTRGNLYGAEQGNINTGYQMGMSTLGSNYGNTMGIRGQALQNTLNNNQQRIANNMGYQQLGKGMAGMSANYLQQAGSGYTNIAGQAGQTAIGIGGLNNNYNATMQDAQAKKDAKGGEMLGSAVGAGAMAFSDIRLKRNLQKVGEYNGLDIYEWDWTEDAKLIVGDTQPIGFIAQHVQDVYPDFVSVNEETGYLQIAYNKIIGGLSWDLLMD